MPARLHPQTTVLYCGTFQRKPEGGHGDRFGSGTVWMVEEEACCFQIVEGHSTKPDSRLQHCQQQPLGMFVEGVVVRKRSAQAALVEPRNIAHQRLLGYPTWKWNLHRLGHMPISVKAKRRVQPDPGTDQRSRGFAPRPSWHQETPLADKMRRRQCKVATLDQAFAYNAELVRL